MERSTVPIHSTKATVNPSRNTSPAHSESSKAEKIQAAKALIEDLRRRNTLDGALGELGELSVGSSLRHSLKV